MSARGGLVVEPGTYAAAAERPMEPFAFYRLRFESRCAGPAYWAADFFDGGGAQNYADNYSGIDPSEDWAPAEGFFFARAGTARGRTGFRAIAHPLAVRGVDLAPATRAETLDWMRAMRERMPPVEPAPPAAPWERLGNLRGRLRAGGTVRWVALGDSLSNDLLNGMGHLWIEEAFPGARIEMAHANGPEKSCANYDRDDVLERLVYPHRPDVLMVAGMSHVGQQDAIRGIIARTRAACGDLDALFVNVSVKNQPDQADRRDAFLAALEDDGARDRFAVFNVSALWEDYLRASPRPHAWFERDHAHANDRGKVVLGRLFASRFPAG